MNWLDGAIILLQRFSQLLDKLKQLEVLAFIAAIQFLLVVSFAWWAAGKLWSLAEALLGPSLLGPIVQLIRGIFS